jgi:hypothetical protein
LILIHLVHFVDTASFLQVASFGILAVLSFPHIFDVANAVRAEEMCPLDVSTCRTSVQRFDILERLASHLSHTLLGMRGFLLGYRPQH